jgi:lipopolysaccharide export LptBFGC system permease protein LptF
MNMHNPNLHNEHQRLEAVEARLAWHKKILGIAILLVICMAAVTLALLALRIP